MEARVWRSHIREQLHAVSLQIETDAETTTCLTPICRKRAVAGRVLFGN